VWDAASGQELLTLRGYSDAVTSVAWSPDGKKLVTAGQNGLVQIYVEVSPYSLKNDSPLPSMPS
jgi:WD40 repeat protein